MGSRKQIDEIEELKLKIERLKGSTQWDSREELAKAQFNLGNIFKKDDIEKAIQAWSSIQRDDSPEQFARAQFNLGNAFKRQGNIGQAIQAWESIKREDFPHAFAKAQFNSGLAFKQQNEIERAIQAWKAITRDDSPEEFTMAQVNLGVTFKQQNKIKKAIQAWRGITRDDSPEQFAMAQFNLGVAFYEKGKIKSAIQAWKTITRDDSPEQFARAQVNLGVTFKQQNEIKNAIQAWRAITRDDSLEQFAMAQFNLGMTFHEQGYVDKAISYFLKVYGIEDYRYNLLKNILDLGNEKFKEPLVSIFTCIDDILKNLKVSWKKKDFETKIAHYTTPTVGFMMLDNNNKKPSKFRLNTIKGVNDPEEGKVLYKYLDKELQNDESLITFISCFTFNHDSLNQFRLYGKDSGKEASGISLVIPKDKFFNQGGDIYSSINLNQDIQKESLDSSVQEKTTSYIHTLSLYRCIYLDPYQKDNELYLKVSHRDEWTFYRENNNEDISSRWEEYQVKIKDIEDNVRANLAKIKEFFIKIKGDKQAVNIAEKIVLPLRYLIKHAAFREEQECRIIYVSDVCDEKIKVDNEKSQMYIEYGCDLKDAIHKIYLSPGAEKYKDHFRHVLKNTDAKVISSTNPFRIK